MIDLTPLMRFKFQVERYQKRLVNEAAVQVVRAVSLILTDYVQETYPDAIVTPLSIDKQAGTVTAIIDVHATDLWFREFGTGFVGAATYDWSYHPETTLSFYSRGGPQSTVGWEHAYHPETKRMGGWWYIDPTTGRYTFTEGQPAENGVSRALLRIRFGGIPQLAEYISMNLR